MEELWIKDKSLVSEENWVKEIDNLNTDTVINDKSAAKSELKTLLHSAIQLRIPQDKFGIFFSGGVDSSFIAAVCKEFKADFICYAVGFQDEETKEPEAPKEEKPVEEIKKSE